MGKKRKERRVLLSAAHSHYYGSIGTTCCVILFLFHCIEIPQQQQQQQQQQVALSFQLYFPLWLISFFLVSRTRRKLNRILLYSFPLHSVVVVVAYSSPRLTYSRLFHTHTEKRFFVFHFLTGKKIFVSKFTAYDGSDLLKSCWCYPWRLAQTNSAIS
jgi:hypothetical protein